MYMKILFYCNNPSREKVINSFIGDELKRINNLWEIYELPFSTKKEDFYHVLELAPDIIFTYPITTEAQAKQYTLFKYLLNCKVIAFATEGVWDFDDKEFTKNMAGYYDYDQNVIDYHCFWGPKAAKDCGDILIKRKRLADCERIKVFGYPLYEKEKVFNLYKDNELVRHVKICNEKAKKSILILTGFQGADFTQEQIASVGDYVPSVDSDNYEARLIFWTQFLQNFKNLRDNYVNTINKLAKDFPDYSFWVKLHPSEIENIERNRVPYNYYEKLHSKNIHIIVDRIPLGAYLNQMDCLIHYGSTASLEAYIYKIPSLYLYYEEMQPHFRRISSESIEVTDYKKCADYVRAEMSFAENMEMQSYILESMNYVMDKDYAPSRDIAEFIDESVKEHNLVIDYSNKRLKEILDSCYLYRIIILKNFLRSLVKTIWKDNRCTFSLFVKVYRNPMRLIKDLIVACFNRIFK